MSQDRVYFDHGADNYLDVVGLQNDIDLTYPSDAVVALTIYNRAGAVVTGTLNLPGVHVVGTTGAATTYRVFVQDTIAMPLGFYEGRGTASKAGVVWKFYVPITVKKG